MKNFENKLYKRALLLEYLTIAWNIFEGLSSMLVGFLTGSISLFAYGLESSVEIFASSVVVWDLKGADKKRERTALKLIGFAYLVVSFYIFIDASKSFLSGHHPDRTFIGIILMIIAACIMTWLGISKKIVGEKLKSSTVIADSKFTLIDASLATTVLLGLFFNAVFGLWWVDQAIALFLSGVAFREGLKEIF